MMCILIGLAILAIGSYFLLLYYFLKQPTQPNASIKKSISIIICAKNEALNLEKNLASILTQNYPNFELLIIDDASTDGTQSIIQQYQKQYANIKYHYFTTKKGKGKKYLLEQAAQLAQNEILAFIDADCIPASANWLQHINVALQHHFVAIGISPYTTTNSWVGLLQEYETVQTCLQYIAATHVAHPYMCVGRNWACDKAIYQQQQWTSNELELASGDDDIMLQKLAKQYKVATYTTPESYTYSAAKESFLAWLQQKLRHYATGTTYAIKHQLILMLLLSVKLLFYVVVVLTLPTSSFLLLLYLVTISIVYAILNYRNKIAPHWYCYLFIDVILVIAIIIMGIISTIKPPQTTWK